MLIHRYSTFTHVVSVSRIQWIWKGVCKKDKTKNPDPRHHNAVLNMFKGNRGSLKKSIRDLEMDHWNECETKKEEPETDSDDQSDNKGKSFTFGCSMTRKKQGLEISGRNDKDETFHV